MHRQLVVVRKSKVKAFLAPLKDSAQLYHDHFLSFPSGSAGIYQRRLLIYTTFPDELVCRLCVCVCVFASSWSTYTPPSLLLSGKSKCVSVPVPLHLSTPIRRWGDNCEGMIVKEIIGDSIPPDRSWSGLGF